MTGLKALIESQRFEAFVMVLIVINAITLGLETSATAVAAFGPLLSAVDAVSELASTTAAIVVPSLIPYVSPVGASLVNFCD